MAKKTVLVSDLSGDAIEEGKGAKIRITFDDARRVGAKYVAALMVTVLGALAFWATASSAAAQPRPKCAGLSATMVGTAGPDQIVGTFGRDVIVAGGGADQIRGLSGNDVICVGAGPDQVRGGGGRDRIFGGPGSDQLEGGLGPDLLSGRAGFDIGHGGAGFNRCRSVELADKCV